MNFQRDVSRWRKGWFGEIGVGNFGWPIMIQNFIQGREMGRVSDDGGSQTCKLGREYVVELSVVDGVLAWKVRRDQSVVYFKLAMAW